MGRSEAPAFPVGFPLSWGSAVEDVTVVLMLKDRVILLLITDESSDPVSDPFCVRHFRKNDFRGFFTIKFADFQNVR